MKSNFLKQDVKEKNWEASCSYRLQHIKHGRSLKHAFVSDRGRGMCPHCPQWGGFKQNVIQRSWNESDAINPPLPIVIYDCCSMKYWIEWFWLNFCWLTKPGYLWCLVLNIIPWTYSYYFSYKRTSKTDVKCSWLKHPKSAPPKHTVTISDLYPQKQLEYRYAFLKSKTLNFSVSMCTFIQVTNKYIKICINALEHSLGKLQMMTDHFYITS